MPSGVDLTGQQFGQLTVIERAEQSIGGGHAWRCRCTCGNWITATTSQLRGGHRKTCGAAHKALGHDLTGRRFGRLVAQQAVGSSKQGGAIWRCQCDCGNETQVDYHSLISGHKQSCGCLRKKPRFQDISGQRFGRLVAIRPASLRARNGNAMWVCQCDCGNQITIDVQRLKNGSSRSCGCLRRELARKRMTTNPKTVAHFGDTSVLFDKNGIPTAAFEIHSRNKSGVLGVHFDQTQQVWNARMMRHGVLVLNKSFKNFSDAVVARREAERKYLPAEYQHLD